MLVQVESQPVPPPASAVRTIGFLGQEVLEVLDGFLLQQQRQLVRLMHQKHKQDRRRVCAGHSSPFQNEAKDVPGSAPELQGPRRPHWRRATRGPGPGPGPGRGCKPPSSRSPAGHRASAGRDLGQAGHPDREAFWSKFAQIGDSFFFLIFCGSWISLKHLMTLRKMHKPHTHTCVGPQNP